MPNSLQSSAIASPASRRATNCSLSSIAEHSFQGITPSPLRGESVTYVSGTMCYPCLRSVTQCLCGHSRFCLSPEFPAKPFVNDLSTSGIAICRPRRHRRHHDLPRGFTDCLNFLLTATAPRHSRNGKNINVHSRHIGLWKSSLQNQRSQIRGVTVIDTCVIGTIVRLIR